MKRDENCDVVFSEDVQGVHNCSIQLKSGEFKTLTIIESIGSFTTYVSGEPTGHSFDTLQEAKRSLHDLFEHREYKVHSLDREFELASAEPSWRRRATKAYWPFSAQSFGSGTSLFIVLALAGVFGAVAAGWWFFQKPTSHISGPSMHSRDLDTPIMTLDKRKPSETLTIRELITE